MIISGFPGVGKTTLQRKYSNVIDLDAMPYKFNLNTEQYIKKKSDSFYSQIEYLVKNSERCWKLEPGEYLEDRIIKEQITLKE